MAIHTSILAWRISMDRGAWRATQVAPVLKNPPANARRHKNQVRSLGWEDPLEEYMATHSSILAWRIPRREEPGGLKSMGSQDLDTT